MQREFLKKEEERWNVKAIAMNHQGSWARWENVKESMDHGKAPDQVPIVLSMMFYGPHRISTLILVCLKE